MVHFLICVLYHVLLIAALGEAMQIAHALCTFPQECMRQDRMSAYYSMYEASSFKDAMEYEFSKGIEIVAKESIQGTFPEL